MSAEADFRATLAAHAPLTALVVGRIALNALPQGSALPIVVYTATHVPQLNLLGVQLDDEVTFEVQCWADSAATAQAVADAVQAAVGTAPAANAAAVVGRATGYDADLQLDATVLTVSWWA